MTRSVNLSTNLITFGVPLAMITIVILLIQTPLFKLNPEMMSIGISVDLLITIPIVYFLLIRKRSIPKVTVITLIIVGSVIASIIVPPENQSLLTQLKIWLIPFAEIAILGLIIYKVKKSVALFGRNKAKSSDFYSVLKNTCSEMLPKKTAYLIATEIAVLYYAFIHWKKSIYCKNEFTYHKNSGTPALLGTITLIIIIETIVLHLLIAIWSVTSAWILTFLSIYTGLQVFGALKSIIKRPILIANGKLYLRYGVLNETTIDLNSIDLVEITSRPIDASHETKKLSPLGDLESHNMIITLKNENTLFGLYGINKKYRSIAFHVDDKDKFKTLLLSHNTIDS